MALAKGRSETDKNDKPSIVSPGATVRMEKAGS